MKTTSVSCALLFVVTGTVSAEMVSVVELTDFQKRSTFDIKNSADLRTLRKQLEAEARVFPKAMEQIRKEWDAVDKSVPPPPPPKPGEKREKPVSLLPFPSGMLASRKVEVKGEFADAQKAAKKKEQCETRMFDSESKEMKRKQEAAKNPKEKEALSREHDRELAAERAAGMLESKIAELIKNAASGEKAPAIPAVPAPPAGGAGDKEKPAGAPK